VDIEEQLKELTHHIKQAVANKSQIERDELRAIYNQLASITGHLDRLHDMLDETQRTLTNSFDQRRAHYDSILSEVKETASETQLYFAQESRLQQQELKTEFSNKLSLLSAVNIIIGAHFFAVVVGVVSMFAALAMQLLTEETVSKIATAYAAGLGPAAIYAIKVWVDTKQKDKKKPG